MEDGDLRALSIGSDTFYPSYLADGIPFHFKPKQNQFLIAHQKTKNADIAAQMVGETADWAKNFLSSRKFRKFVHSMMAQCSIKNGLTVEWWYQYGKWITDGHKEHYAYDCSFCQFQGNLNSYEAEMTRNDDLTFTAECNCCFKPVALVHVKEPFTPTREQVEGWKEIGSRILPKIERVHHEFEKTEILFSTEGQ